MATSNRGGSSSGNRGGSSSGNRGGSQRRRGGRNNNPEGRNQYSGLTGTARANPLATAAVVGAAAAAGAFLWSRRNLISEQIADLSDTISDWRDRAGDEDAGDGRSQREIAEEALTLKEIGETA